MRKISLNVIRNTGRIEVMPTELINIPHIRAVAGLIDSSVDWGSWMTPVTIRADFDMMFPVEIEAFVDLLFHERVEIVD